MIRITAILIASLLLASTAHSAPLDIPAIESAAGKKGAWYQQEKVYKLTFPHKIETTIPQPLLTSWASFKGGNEFPAIMMGEVFLLSEDVNPAISAALDGGLEVTALNAPYPGIYALHIGGEGTAQQLAAGVRKVTESLGHAKPKPPAAAAPKGMVSPQQLDAIFNATGDTRDGIYRIAIGREVSMPCACKAGTEMGIHSAAAFYGSDDNAAAAGQIACVFGEMKTVLKTLRAGGIEITAISNHLEAEAPRMIFIHYIAAGRASELAKTIKSALDVLGKMPDMQGHEHHHH